jgi:hypothetical protein
MVRGIRPKLAERIVAVYGAATSEIIEANPEKLGDVSGIGEFRAEKIAAGWAEQKAVRDIMLFLALEWRRHVTRGPHLQNLRKREGDACPHPLGRLARHAEFHGDGVRR